MAHREIQKYLQASSIQSDAAELWQKTGELVKARDAQRLNNISYLIEEFLDRLYITAGTNERISRRNKILVVGALIFVLIVFVTVIYSPLKAKYHKEIEEYNIIANEEAYKKQTLNDVLQLKKALEQLPETIGDY